MDFGSLVQTKRNPKWDLCPLTKKGICRAAKRFERVMLSGAKRRRSTKHMKREPGRFVGTTYIPNRIFRGKIVEELRDAKSGLKLSEIGRRVCLDWKPVEHSSWLKALLQKLESDALISRRQGAYILAES